MVARLALSVEDPERNNHAVANNKKDRRNDQRHEAFNRALQHGKVSGNNHCNTNPHDEVVLSGKRDVTFAESLLALRLLLNDFGQRSTPRDEV